MAATMATAAFGIGFVAPIGSTRKATPTMANDIFIGRLIMVTE
jgi:hypothetical protein